MAIDLKRLADEFMDEICTALIYPSIEPDEKTKDIVNEFKPRLLDKLFIVSRAACAVLDGPCFCCREHDCQEGCRCNG